MEVPTKGEEVEAARPFLVFPKIWAKEETSMDRLQQTRMESEGEGLGMDLIQGLATRAAQEVTTLEGVEQTRLSTLMMEPLVGEVVVISLGVREGVEGVAVVVVMAGKEEQPDRLVRTLGVVASPPALEEMAATEEKQETGL